MQRLCRLGLHKKQSTQREATNPIPLPVKEGLSLFQDLPIGLIFGNARLEGRSVCVDLVPKSVIPDPLLSKFPQVRHTMFLFINKALLPLL